MGVKTHPERPIRKANSLEAMPMRNFVEWLLWLAYVTWRKWKRG